MITFGNNEKILVTDTAASAAMPGSRLLITTNVDCYVRFGGLIATATDFDVFMPAGGMIPVNPTPGGTISVIRDSTNGVLCIHAIL